MRARYAVIGVVVGILLSSAAIVLAGSLDPPSGPSDAASQMYTLEQIYDRLDTGAESAKMTGFTEPAAGPGATGHTLNDIMDVAPAADNTDGAVPSQVLDGKTYWGLRTDGTWGPQTGTAPQGSNVNGPDGSRTFDIPDGLYSGQTATANDADLVAGNIKLGVNLFGVDGTMTNTGVPKTGQTTPYVTRDDGDLQMGVAWPVPRFITGTTGVVTDSLTGLIWLENAHCAKTTRDWTTALLTDISHLNAFGTMNGFDCGDTSNGGSHQTDWRLPNVREMHSLVHYGVFDPSVPNTAGTGKWSDGDPFTGIQSYGYWTSTTRASHTSWAWTVDLYNGEVNMNLRTGIYNVWPVRGGQ